MCFFNFFTSLRLLFQAKAALSEGCGGMDVTTRPERERGLPPQNPIARPDPSALAGVCLWNAGHECDVRIVATAPPISLSINFG